MLKLLVDYMPEVFLIVILALFVMFIGARLAPFFRNMAYRRKIRRSGLDDIDDGHDFEIFVVNLLKKNGFRDIRVTPKTGDYGADILAVLDGDRYAIQCKLYGKSVGIKAVQEVYAAMQYYECQAAAVATNSNFSKNARNLADSTGVYLWDRDVLIDMSQNR